ncbi:MAG TPA: hypothetical protein VLH40_03335 [Atribacteraceae bacterium]|nr:hypothetical protein [Atribacteraceae bacterium]
MRKTLWAVLIILYMVIMAGCANLAPPPTDEQQRIRAEVFQWISGFENAWESNEVEALLPFYHYPHVQFNRTSGVYAFFPTEEQFRAFLDPFLQVTEVVENQINSVRFLKVTREEVIFEALETARKIEDGREVEEGWGVRIALVNIEEVWKLGVYEILEHL